MKGIGIDLAKISRFKRVKKADFNKWCRIFSEAEWVYGFKDAHTAEHLAGIFASKEAAMKANKKAGVAHFRDWEIKHTSDGTPELFYKGEKLNNYLSISHDAGTAIAVVVII